MTESFPHGVGIQPPADRIAAALDLLDQIGRLLFEIADAPSHDRDRLVYESLTSVDAAEAALREAITKEIS